MPDESMSLEFLEKAEWLAQGGRVLTLLIPQELIVVKSVDSPVG